MTALEIWTDGSADNLKSRVGGWAALMRFGEHEKIICGSEVDTTSIRMELTAAVEALESLVRPATLTLYTDSQFLVKGVTGQYRRLTENLDLWARVFEQNKRHLINWVWVQGHAGVRENELVDGYAVDQRRMREVMESKKEPAQVFDFNEARKRLKDAEEDSVWPQESLECERRYSDGDSYWAPYYRLKPFISDYGDPGAKKIVVNGRTGILLNVIMPMARVVFDDAPLDENLGTKKEPLPASVDVPAVEVKPLRYS